MSNGAIGDEIRLSDVTRLEETETRHQEKGAPFNAFHVLGLFLRLALSIFCQPLRIKEDL